MESDRHATGPAGDEAEVIAPTASLRDKVRLVKAGEPDPLELAKQVVADQSASYLERARGELAALHEAYDGVVNVPSDRSAALRSMFRVAHDLKGQGKSFGYDMITDIASSMCEMLRDRTEMSETGIKVVKMHIDALNVVFDHDLQGDGGKQGRLLVDHLTQLVAGNVD